MARWPGREQVEHGQATALRQLGHRVGGVVRTHPGQHRGDFRVRARVKQPDGEVLVQLLEHVGLKLGIGVHPAEDLCLLLRRRALQQVGDLGQLQPADPGERAADRGGARVADERLEVVPVPEVPRGGSPEPRTGEPRTERPPRPAPGVHPGQHPRAGLAGDPCLAG